MVRWRVRLSPTAQSDLKSLLEYTEETFGTRQEVIYRATIKAALMLLHRGPDVRGSVVRHDISAHLRSLHVARKGRKGRHVLINRAKGEQTIEVVRILHDAMDLARHLLPEE